MTRQRSSIAGRCVGYGAAVFLSGWAIGQEVPGLGLSVTAIGALLVAATAVPLLAVGRFRLRLPGLLTAFLLMHVIVINPFDQFAFKFDLLVQVLVMFLFLLAIVNRASDLLVYERMVGILLATSALVVGTLTVLHWFVFNSTFLSPNFTFEDYAIRGRFGRNTLSFFVSIVFPFAYARFSYRRTPYNLLVMGTLGFAILYTISRSALLSLGLSLILFAMLGGHARRYRRQVLVIGLVVALVLPVVYDVNLWLTFMRLRNPAAQEAVEAGDVAFVSLEGDRYNLIWWSLDGFRSSPLFGRGLGSFQAERGAETHNDYLRLLYEFGLLGLGIFGALVWRTYRDLTQCRPRVPPRHQWLVDGQVVSLLVTCAGLLTINAYDSPPVWFILAGCQILPLAVADRPRAGVVRSGSSARGRALECGHVSGP